MAAGGRLRLIGTALRALVMLLHLRYLQSDSTGVKVPL